MSENSSDEPVEPVDEPTADEPPDRSLSWWPLLAAVVVAAVFLTIIFAVGSDGDSGPGTERDDNGALSCPETYDQPAKKPFWVPSSPSGVDGQKSLVPDTTPSHVTLCGYTTRGPLEADRAKLEGHRTLTDGLRSMTRTLTKAPENNRESIGAEPTSRKVYLVGLTFATGYVWLSVPEGRTGATNGEFVTSESLYDRVARAYETRTWK